MAEGRVKSEQFWKTVKEAIDNPAAAGLDPHLTKEKICNNFGVTSSGLYYAAARFGWLPKTAKRALKRAKAVHHPITPKTNGKFIELAPKTDIHISALNPDSIIVTKGNLMLTCSSEAGLRIILAALEGK